MLNIFRTFSPTKDIVYNTDMENIFNAFSGLENQRLSLGGLTITPASNSTSTFKVTNLAGTTMFSIDTTNSYTICDNSVFKPIQKATTSAPSYIKGGIYFDLTLNKLRVGGATAWETITSV